MNRNTEMHFAELPQIDIDRSIFDLSHSHKTSFNSGELIPILVKEILPGDTVDLTTSAVVRLQTPLTPIMDNMYLDTYFFFVPMRLVWNHAKEFFGENTQSAWLPETEYNIPDLIFPNGGFNIGTIADYMGIPTGVVPAQLVNRVTSLPFRAYALICDEFFRDQNLTDPLVIDKSDNTTLGSNGDNYKTDVAKGGKPFKVAKYHDMFTSCLPSPQKGPSVGIFANDVYDVLSDNNWVPVGTRKSLVDSKYFETDLCNLGLIDGVVGYDGSSIWHNLAMPGSSPGATSIPGGYYRKTNPNNNMEPTQGLNNSYSLTPANLWANIGGLDLTVNQLRLAFQLQKFYEKQARSGTRYREVLKAHFGVTTSDARMQIPEYLGGHRFPLAIHQVANQSQTSGENDFLGDLGAMSNTSDVHDDFIKSFEEHGYLIGLTTVRYDHSYPQGLERFWTRSKKTDFYWPVFANIGEQPIYKSQIMLDNSQDGTEVFGYNEAWCEYRTAINRVSSEMRPNAPQSLATWHLADDYESVPSLSDEWIREDKSNVDRVLSVSSSVANQIFADFYFNLKFTRAMPTYSIPGLIDHH